MSEDKHVVLLVGSPKGLERGASAALGRILTHELEASGWKCDAFHLHAAAREDETMTRLLAAIERAHLVVLSTPLYVDSLPAPVIQALYAIAAHRIRRADEHVTRFFSIVNCGFVDPWQNAGAQRMLRLFCAQAHLEHVGDLSLGAGGSVTERIRKALGLIAQALNVGAPILQEVSAMTAGRIIPAFLYILGGNFMWRRQAKANGVSNRLKAQPYKRA